MNAEELRQMRLQPKLVTDIVGCARCQGDGHKKLIFKRLTHPVDLNPPFTHWCSCPTNGEPILLSIEES